MNVLFFARSFYPHVGGVEKHVYELSNNLSQKGHVVTIITEEQRTDNKATIKYDKNLLLQKGIKIYRIPVTTTEKKKKFQIWKWLLTHWEIINNADVVHCHDVFYWYLPFRFIYPMKKVFTTFHGYESYPIKRKAIIYRKIFELLSNGTICVGDFMKKWYRASPSKVTYGAVTIPRNRHKPKSNTAVFIGRLDEQTNILQYADAVKLIRKSIPDFTLTVYGDGPLREKIKQEGVLRMGWNDKAEQLIGHFDFAFASRYLFILEAMAAKRLVFAMYDNPVKKDYLLLSPFANWISTGITSSEIADYVLQYIFSERKAPENTEKAFRWVKQQSWENLTDTYLALWSGV